MLGWWLAVLVYLLPRRGTLRVAAEDTAGAVVAAVCALALVVAALWLQHCCKSPDDRRRTPTRRPADRNPLRRSGRIAEEVDTRHDL